MKLKKKACSVRQVLQQTSGLQPLLQQLNQARLMLDIIREVLPPYLQQQVKAGPIREDEWWLLVANAAAATKLQQLRPMLEAHLQSKGVAVKKLQIKVSLAG